MDATSPTTRALAAVGVIASVALGGCGGDLPHRGGPEVELPADPGGAAFQEFRVPIMGTVLEIVVPTDRAEESARVVVEVFTDVDARMSEWKETSPLSEVNRRAGEAVAVPADLRTVLERALRIGEMTDGAFDVTWAALWGVWDFRAEGPAVPDPSEVARRAAKVDYGKVEVDAEAGTVRLVESGMVLGLGGIAKGYALDRAASRLGELGVEDFLLSAGGQLYVGGTREGEPWTVGLRDPRGAEGDAFASLDVRDVSVATSGDYERFFVRGGVRYHHILDPRTGTPARGLQSATVVSQDATLADALATAFVVMGVERSLALAGSLDGLEAVLVDPDGQVHVTPGLEGRLRVLHPPSPDPLCAALRAAGEGTEAPPAALPDAEACTVRDERLACEYAPEEDPAARREQVRLLEARIRRCLADGWTSSRMASARVDGLAWRKGGVTVILREVLGDEAALRIEVLPAGSAGLPAGPIPWIRDDWDTALAKAGAEGKPLVVDLWAPWCHTCLSMKHYVFPDASLRALADRYVWLALDTDRPQNAEALERLRPEVWPTFYVVSPDGTIQARHAGATSVEGFRAFLRRGEQAVLEGRDLDPSDPLYHLREGDRLAAQERYAAAEVAWAEAMDRAPEGWERAPEVLVRSVRARYRLKEYASCARFGLEHLATAVAARDASAGDFAKYAALCATKQEDDALARRVHEALVAPRGSLREALEEREPGAMSTDDWSDAMVTLREAWEAVGEEGRARATAEAQARVLDRAVEEAPSPQAEMTWAWPRAEVYVYLGRGEEALPWLEALAAKLPEEYDPPYRVAWVLHRLGRDAEALPWAERAWEKAYGARKERIGELLETLRTAR